MRIVVPAGGVGAARFLRGLRAAAPDAEVTVIGNTGDDIRVWGLQVCPDLDSVMYALAEVNDEERGWGRADDTWSVRAELRAYGVEPTWFNLGDKDVATAVVRTQMLAAGYPLSQVTAALAARWDLGVRLLPMTDDRVETHVVVDDAAGGRRAIHFQEWWVRHRAALPARAFVPVGVDTARPAPGVLEAVAAADVVLIPPSNPVVSLGVVLAVPGLREAILAAAAPVVGVSPIIGGAPVRGMADACLTAIGVAVDARAVAAHLGADLLDGWLVDTADAAGTGGAGGTGEAVGVARAGDVALPGVTVRAAPLLMSSPQAAADLARAALELAGELRAGSGG